MSVPTYYVPSGFEHSQQTANEPAEIRVLQLALGGFHVHTWSKDTGVMCVDGLDEVSGENGRTVKVPRLVDVERGKSCALGDKERY